MGDRFLYTMRVSYRLSGSAPEAHTQRVCHIVSVEAYRKTGMSLERFIGGKGDKSISVGGLSFKEGNSSETASFVGHETTCTPSPPS